MGRVGSALGTVVRCGKCQVDEAEATDLTLLANRTNVPGRFRGPDGGSASRAPARLLRRLGQADVRGRRDDGEDRDDGDAEDGETGRADQPRALAVAPGIATDDGRRFGRGREG